VAGATQGKHLSKAKVKRGAKRALKKARTMKPPSTPAVETVVVDVVEEPVPGVAVVTEIEATEVREAGAGPEEPEESRSPPESEEPYKTVTSHAGASCRRVSLMNRRLHCRATKSSSTQDELVGRAIGMIRSALENGSA
jgi:hypothetical protein